MVQEDSGSVEEDLPQAPKHWQLGPSAVGGHQLTMHSDARAMTPVMDQRNTFPCVFIWTVLTPLLETLASVSFSIPKSSMGEGEKRENHVEFRVALLVLCAVVETSLHTVVAHEYPVFSIRQLSCYRRAQETQ